MIPKEISELVLKVSDQKQNEVQAVLNQIFSGTSDWERQVDEINVKGIEDKMSMQLAEVARKNAKQARLNGEKIFDQKREEVQKLKLEFDLEDKLWLKAKQIMQLKFKAIEEKAEWKANFVKRFEAEQKELKTQRRILEVQQYDNAKNRIEFENMSDSAFESYLSGLKLNSELKKEAERLAEEERLKKEKKEKEEREKQRLENERLKLEAEKREKEIELERKKQKEEIERLARIEAEKREKLEAELKAKKDAEIKAENERKQAELKAKAEAEKNAKAPIKKQLSMWVDSFELPQFSQENETANEIESKFISFKNWAKKTVENI